MAKFIVPSNTFQEDQQKIASWLANLETSDVEKLLPFAIDDLLQQEQIRVDKNLSISELVERSLHYEVLGWQAEANLDVFLSFRYFQWSRMHECWTQYLLKDYIEVLLLLESSAHSEKQFVSILNQAAAYCDLELIPPENTDISLDIYGRNTIHQAVISRNLPLLQYLLAEGKEDINLHDEMFWSCTPLSYAVQKNDFTMVSLLVEHGADYTLHSSLRRTLLFDAVLASRGNKDIIDLLLSLGLSPDESDASGLTPRHIYFLVDHYNPAQFLEGTTEQHLFQGAWQLLEVETQEQADTKVQEMKTRLFGNVRLAEEDHV